jgi:N-dimethylarginine dimethylaminohydrolase
MDFPCSQQPSLQCLEIRTFGAWPNTCEDALPAPSLARATPINIGPAPEKWTSAGRAAAARAQTSAEGAIVAWDYAPVARLGTRGRPLAAMRGFALGAADRDESVRYSFRGREEFIAVRRETSMTNFPLDPQNAVKPAVNSWDEFTQLREIIVGDVTHARLPAQTDISAWLACFPTLTKAEVEEVQVGEFPLQVIEETREDLTALVETLRGLGVTTHQPPAVDHRRTFSSPQWSSDGYLSYCPRDVTLVVGNAIIETSSPMRARYFETFNMRPLFQRYLDRGAHWLSMPKPQLADELFALDEDDLPILGEAEPAFDAANVLRIGRDLIYQVSRSGNEAGLRWLENTVSLLGRLRIHPLRGLYGYTHIDTTIVLLRPGLVMLNPERVRRGSVPEVFKGWDILWCPPLEIRTPLVVPNISSPWISMNLLMVNPDLAIADATQPGLLKALESHGIEVIPQRLRHAQVLGGGFHCVTLDIVRDGGPEDYFG